MTRNLDEQDLAALPIGDVLGFMRLLWAVDHGLQSTSKQMETHLGVTGPQRLALRIVGRFPGITAGRLAGVLRLHPSTITGILQRLIDRGLLKRHADPCDRRRALFNLTATGRRLNRVTSGTVEAAVQRTLERLTPAKLTGARDVLAALAGELAG